jgi:hypothetical protein
VPEFELEPLKSYSRFIPIRLFMRFLQPMVLIPVSDDLDKFDANDPIINSIEMNCQDYCNDYCLICIKVKLPFVVFFPVAIGLEDKGFLGLRLSGMLL